jgi:hypothetical protein
VQLLPRPDLRPTIAVPGRTSRRGRCGPPPPRLACGPPRPSGTERMFGVRSVEARWTTPATTVEDHPASRGQQTRERGRNGPERGWPPESAKPPHVATR